MQTVTAKYDNGVLRPLSPLELNDQELVSIVVERLASNPPSISLEQPPSGSLSMYEIFQQAGLIGIIQDEATDLGTNPKYMEGFGKSEQP